MDVSIPPASGQGHLPVAYEFGAFRLEPAEQRLTCDGQPLSLPHRAFDLLVFLVERSGHLVTKEELLQSLWPGLFVEESNITQNVFLLRRALTNGASGHDYIETVPRRGYRFIAPVKAVLPEPAALPPVAAPPPPATSTRVSRPRRLPWRTAAAAALLLVAASICIWLLRAPGAAPAIGIRSLAILPLKSLGAATADEPLGLGIAEGVVSRLSRSRKLVVRPLSSSRKAALLATDAAAAGANLGVDGVLEGSLQHSDGRVRATVTLVRVRDGRVLWSDSFEEPADEVFLLEDSLSNRLVAALGSEIGLDEQTRGTRKTPANPRAYEAYLRGRLFWNRRDVEDLERAVAAFEEAIREDPSYAPAYSGLADAHVLLGPDAPESFPKARRAAERAIALDPNLAEAHASLGFVRFFADWDFEGSERELRRALQLNPGYLTAHQWYAYWLVAAGRPDRAIAEIRRAREIDPTALAVNRDVGHILLYARRYDEAIEELHRALRMDLDFHQARYLLIEALADAGRFDEADAEIQRVPLPHSGRTFRILDASVQARAGRPEMLRPLLPDARSGPEGSDFSAEGAAWMWGVLADYDQAFAWLERAYRGRRFYLVFLNADPQFDRLKSDPRFAALVHRVGIPS